MGLTSLDQRTMMVFQAGQLLRNAHLVAPPREHRPPAAAVAVTVGVRVGVGVRGVVVAVVHGGAGEAGEE